jgi:antitoxin MazE
MASTQLAKWGNSLAVRIPRELAQSAKLREGDLVTLTLADEGRVLVSATRRKYRLKDLVSRITAENRHEETDWGSPVGREMA